MTRSIPSFRLTRPLFIGTSGTLLFVAGWMDVPRLLSLALSSDGEFSGSTEWELEMASFSFLALGALQVSAAAILSRLGQSTARWVQALKSDIAAWRTEEAPRRPRSHNIASAALVLFYLASMLGVLVWQTQFDKGRVPKSFRLVTEENGVYETLTAILLVAAAVYLARTANSLRIRAAHSSWLVTAVPFGLSMLFILAAGEELSWGQHYFGFATPEAMEEVNVQNEFNLHNIGGYWANNALILFFFGFAGVLPLTVRFFWDVAYACERLNVPISHFWLAPVALISVVFDEREPFVSFFGHPIWRLSEIREALFGSVMLAACREYWLRFGGTLPFAAEPYGTKNPPDIAPHSSAQVKL